MLNSKEVKLYEEISCYGEKGLVTGTGPNGLHVRWPGGQMIYYRWGETGHLELIGYKPKTERAKCTILI